MKETKLKEQKGITVIVLIITIIIMLILVTVSITLSINGGLFEKAGEAVKNQSTKQTQENELSESATSYIEQKTAIATEETYLIGETTELPAGWSDTGVNKALVEICKGQTCCAPIPEGYVLSGATGEDRISEGLVIYEGTEPVTDENVETAKTTRNQFVWVPVNEIGDVSEYRPTEMLAEDNTQANLDIINNILGTEYTTSNALLIDMQSDFDSLVSSIQLYKGFYIGRYETSNMNTSSATIIAGTQDGINNLNWYTMYGVEKAYGNGISRENIKTSMWFGFEFLENLCSLFEERNMQEIINSNEFVCYQSVSDTGTGKLLNIYDSETNLSEWSTYLKEVDGAKSRTYCGAVLNSIKSQPGYDVICYGGKSQYNWILGGSRMTLWIPVE